MACGQTDSDNGCDDNRYTADRASDLILVFDHGRVISKASNRYRTKS